MYQKMMSIHRQALLFLVVGGVNTLVGYGLYAFFIYCGMSYPLAIFFATVLGVLFNFKTIGTIVFRKTETNRLFKFIAVYVLGYLLNISLLQLGQFITNNLYLAGFLGIIPTAIGTFILNKFFVFRETYETN